VYIFSLVLPGLYLIALLGLGFLCVQDSPQGALGPPPPQDPRYCPKSAWLVLAGSCFIWGLVWQVLRSGADPVEGILTVLYIGPVLNMVLLFALGFWLDDVVWRRPRPRDLS